MALLEYFKAGAVLLMLLKVKTPAPVEPLASSVVYPVELAKLSVAAAVAVPIVTLSIDVRVGLIATAVFKVAIRVSVPVVPFNTSAEPSVWTPAAKEPSKESLPVPPEKLLTPVVSGQIQWFYFSI